MELNSHLTFSGQCAQAFKFYEQCLGGTIAMMMTYGESPAKDQVPAEMRDRVIHARLVVGGRLLMGCDAPPDRYEAPKGITVSINTASPEEAERVFNALAENGKVTMPFQKTFWSSGFGMATDRFGIPWMVNCEQAPAL